LKYNQASDIPDSVVEDIKSKKTYARIAQGRANKLGIDLSELPDDEWRTIWWNRAKRREKYHHEQKLRQVQGEHQELKVSQVSGDNDAGLQAYLEFYSDAAPNDLTMLRQLVSMDKQLSDIDALIADALVPDDNGRIRATEYKTLVGIQKQLSSEMRLLQENLGISRRIRDQKRSESELADHLRANIDQARELMEEIGTKLMCSHCLAEDGTEILHGFVIDHFPETGLSLSKSCPTCGRDYVINVPPRQWIRHVETVK
jgi:hypothetical protein